MKSLAHQLLTTANSTFTNTNMTNTANTDAITTNTATNTTLTKNTSPAAASAASSSGRVKLVDFKDVVVRYGSTVVLDHLTWAVHEGEKWCREPVYAVPKRNDLPCSG